MGFSFENVERNQNLLDNGQQELKFTKTGTTIVGILYKDGVVLGADTRASAGTIVAEKNCNKIQKLSEFMYCGGAGTAADADNVKKMLRSQLELHRLLMGGKPVRVCTAVQIAKDHLFRYQGYVSAALIIGGVDETGNHLYSIAPHGSYDKLEYTAMGSGSLAAIAYLETRWKPNMELEEAKKLVRDSIAAGIFNDLGSGNNIDLCVISKDYKVDYLRTYEKGQFREPKQQNYQFKPKSTAIISRTVIPIKNTNIIIRQLGQESREEEAMEIL